MVPLSFAPDSDFTPATSLFFLVVLAFLDTAVYGTHILAHLFGTDVVATLREPRTWTTRNKSRTTQHYAVTGAYTDRSGRSIDIDEEVSWEVYKATRSGELRSMPFVVLDGTSLAFPGHGPTMGGGRFAFTLVASGLAMLLGLVAVRGSREWYEMPKIVVSGSGRLGMSFDE